MYRTVAKLITWRTLFFGNMSQVALFINRSRGVSYSGQYLAKLITWRTLFFGNMSQVALFINRSRGVSYSGQYLLPHSPQKVIQRCTYRAFLEVFCNKCL